MAKVASHYAMPLYEYMNYNSSAATSGAEAALYFFDGAHFTPLVSRMILSRYYPVESQRPADMGVLLTPANVQEEWNNPIEARKVYVQNNKKAVANLIKELT